MNSQNSSELSISVAIITWNRRDYVLRALESVYCQTYQPHEIVVVDSASTDGTTEAIARRYPEVKIIRLHKNYGCPEGRNIALANCSGEIIFTLDDDGWLAPKTLEICLGRFCKSENVGVVTCRILDPEKPGSKNGKERDKTNVDFKGGASAIKKEVLCKAGFYPSDFFRQGEESDLSLRMIDAGYRIIYCPEAVMYHSAAPVGRNTKLFWFYGCRNELYTITRLYPWFMVVPFILMKTISWLLLGLKKGAILYIIAATACMAVRFPKLILQRKPVSYKTIQKVIDKKLCAKFGKG